MTDTQASRIHPVWRIASICNVALGLAVCTPLAVRGVPERSMVASSSLISDIVLENDS